DPEWAAGQVATGAFINTGQLCTSIERIYVHEAVAEDFIDALVARAEAEVVGDGRSPTTTMGPLVAERQRSVVHTHVASAVADGARVLTGGTRAEGAGFFYPPTVLTGVRPDMRVMREETFGPGAAGPV